MGEEEFGKKEEVMVVQECKSARLMVLINSSGFGFLGRLVNTLGRECEHSYRMHVTSLHNSF